MVRESLKIKEIYTTYIRHETSTAQPYHSIRHNSKEHISTGRHGHNLIPNVSELIRLESMILTFR